MDADHFYRILYKLHINGLSKKFTDSLLKNYSHIPKAAFSYAITNEIPFPEGEAAIATNGRYSYEYAAFCLNNQRFPAGEDAIIDGVSHIYDYAYDVLEHSWPEAEKMLFSGKNDEVAAEYFKEYIGKEGWENPTNELRDWMIRQFGECAECGEPLPASRRDCYSDSEGFDTYCSEDCAIRASERLEWDQVDLEVEDAMTSAKPDITTEEIEKAQQYIRRHGYSGDLTEYLIEEGFLPEGE